MDEVNKLSLPATILLGCIVLGGFYYFTETSKSSSIERQHQAELAERQKKEQHNQLWKELCTTEAQDAAIAQYEKTCQYNCIDGYYYTANYDNYYNQCLQRNAVD